MQKSEVLYDGRARPTIEELYKYHLYCLPYPNPGDIPDWEPENPSDTCLVIPLFSFYKDNYVLEQYTRATAWSLLTWKLFSDAEEMNVPCKILVDNLVSDHIVSELCELYNVPETSILVGDARGLHGISQRAAALFDPQFEQYETIVFMDADVFAIAPPGEKLKLFSRLAEGVPDGIGVWQNYHQITPVEKSAAAYWISYDKKTDTLENAVDRWLKTVEEYSNKEVATYFSTPGNEFMYPLSALNVFKKDAIDLDWYWRCMSEGLKDDEAALMVWEKSSEDNVIWDLDDIGIHHVNLQNIMYAEYFIPIKKPFAFNYDSAFLHFFMRGIYDGITGRTSKKDDLIVMDRQD